MNAIGNLELSGAYAEALRKLGHTLEATAEQVSSCSLFWNSLCCRFLHLFKLQEFYNSICFKTSTFQIFLFDTNKGNVVFHLFSLALGTELFTGKKSYLNKNYQIVMIRNKNGMLP